VQLGPAEILVVLVIALLVFGPNKLPEMGRQVGRAMKEFRQFQQTMTRDVHEVFSGDTSVSAEREPTPAPKDTTIDAGSADVSGGVASTGSSREGAADSAADPETHA
jgi:TatA/E family protein of Tat protein translocase